jgi:hypothetical protein
MNDLVWKAKLRQTVSLIGTHNWRKMEYYLTDDPKSAKAISIDAFNRYSEKNLKRFAFSFVDFFSMLVLQDQVRLSKAKHKDRLRQTVHDCNFMRSMIDALSNIQETFSMRRIGIMDLEHRTSRFDEGVVITTPILLLVIPFVG